MISRLPKSVSLCHGLAILALRIDDKAEQTRVEDTEEDESGISIKRALAYMQLKNKPKYK